MIRWIAGGTASLLTALAGATGAAGINLDASRGPEIAPSVTSAGFVTPATGFTVTQPFGCSALAFEPVRPSCTTGHWHSGIDLAAPLGSPVKATLAGTVRVFDSNSGYGLHIILDHGGDLSSLYGHLSTVAVATGSTVEAGQVIAAIGSSGNSTGPHLHFEIRRNGIPEDPAIDVPLH